MKEQRRSFRSRAARELAAPTPPEAMVGHVIRQLVDDSAAMLQRGPADARERATDAREYAVSHLDELHAQLRASMEAHGVAYHRTSTPEEAVALIRRLLGDARRVAKSKTMVGEEIGLTAALRADGRDVMETDIGEYIVDVEGHGPSHITAPALHLNRSRIRDLLVRAGAELPDDSPVRLSRHIRDIVAGYFEDCDAAITGANAAVAASGRLVIVENEGNVSLGLSHPRKHIAVTGLEKVLADDSAALAVLQVLAPSATAQPLTAFTHLTAAPPPGQERHVVFVDNGRSRIAADRRYRDLLRCIRCGACMNACPVYRVAGGLAYGSPYMGPVGAVLSPLLWSDGRYADLPRASTLCGRCAEVCPVGIPLDAMLLELRSDLLHTAGRPARALWRTWAALYARRLPARVVTELGARVLPLMARIAGGRLPLGAINEPRDPAAVAAATAGRPAPPRRDAPAADEGTSLGSLFRERAVALGIEVVASDPAPSAGDITVDARAAVAGTGSVLIAGSGVDRRALLGAARIVVRVDPSTLVRHPADLLPFLRGSADALLLTGASRTADIEKQIVAGIHGPGMLAVVLPDNA